MLTMVSMGGTVTRIIVALTSEQSETALYHLHLLQILVVTQNPFYCSSQLSMVHWLSSPIFPFCLVVRPAMVTPDQISLLLAQDPPNTYIF